MDSMLAAAMCRTKLLMVSCETDLR
jgi:hypothetical protein